MKNRNNKRPKPFTRSQYHASKSRMNPFTGMTREESIEFIEWTLDVFGPVIPSGSPLWSITDWELECLVGTCTHIWKRAEDDIDLDDDGEVII